MEPSSEARAPLKGLPKTIHGGQAWKLKGIEDYSHNLNPFGPPDCLAEMATAAMGDVGHYPDDSSLGFRTAVAEEFGVKPENVIAGAGSSDIIRMFPNTFLSEGDAVAVFSPSFAEYAQQCKLCGVEVERISLRAENDYRIDIDDIKNTLSNGVRAVYICNPNNPTGRVEPRDKILGIARICEDAGAMVFLDETLLELVDGYKDVSCASFVDDYTNLLVAGSLTKSFAVPGIRIGFGISNVKILDEMNKVRMTWNIGALEQRVGEGLVSGHMDYVRDASKILSEESERMYLALSEMGFPVNAPSDSFFFFCDLSPLGMDADSFVERMLEHGIMVRNCSSFGDEYRGCVRFCVKDRARNDRFLEAVHKILE